MSIIQIVYGNATEQDRIAILWNLMRMVRQIPDEPYLWKLTDPFLDAICQYLNLHDRISVLNTSFLDTGLDVTTNAPCLICVEGAYPVELV